MQATTLARNMASVPLCASPGYDLLAMAKQVVWTKLLASRPEQDPVPDIHGWAQELVTVLSEPWFTGAVSLHDAEATAIHLLRSEFHLTHLTQQVLTIATGMLKGYANTGSGMASYDPIPATATAGLHYSPEVAVAATRLPESPGSHSTAQPDITSQHSGHQGHAQVTADPAHPGAANAYGCDSGMTMHVGAGGMPMGSILPASGMPPGALAAIGMPPGLGQPLGSAMQLPGSSSTPGSSSMAATSGGCLAPVLAGTAPGALAIGGNIGHMWPGVGMAGHLGNSTSSREVVSPAGSTGIPLEGPSTPCRPDTVGGYGYPDVAMPTRQDITTRQGTSTSTSTSTSCLDLDARTTPADGTQSSSSSSSRSIDSPGSLLAERCNGPSSLPTSNESGAPGASESAATTSRTSATATATATSGIAGAPAANKKTASANVPAAPSAAVSMSGSHASSSQGAPATHWATKLTTPKALEVAIKRNKTMKNKTSVLQGVLDDPCVTSYIQKQRQRKGEALYEKFMDYLSDFNFTSDIRNPQGYIDQMARRHFNGAA